MICKNCGTQLPDNSVFCGNCGSPVTPETPQPMGFGGDMPNPAMNPSPNGGFDPNQNSNGGFNSGMNGGFDPNQNQNGGFNSGMNGGFDPNQNPNGGFNPNMNPNPNAPANGVMGKLGGNKKILTIVIAAVAGVAILAAIGVGVTKAFGSDPDKTIDRFMTAFLAQDGEAMSAEVSPSYKQAIVYTMETYDILMDGEISKEAGGDLDSYVEDLCADSFEDVANEYDSEFKYNVGNNYKAEYEITAEEVATDEERDKFNELVQRISKKDFNTNGLILADIEITAKSGSKEYEDRFTLFLCKDGSDWRVIDIYEYGYTFEDLYSGFNLNEFENMME